MQRFVQVMTLTNEFKVRWYDSFVAGRDTIIAVNILIKTGQRIAGI